MIPKRLGPPPSPVIKKKKRKKCEDREDRRTKIKPPGNIRSTLKSCFPVYLVKVTSRLAGPSDFPVV